MQAATTFPSNVCAQDGVPAEAACTRCGRFVCSRCRRWQAEQALCFACRDRLGSRPSPQATLSLVLATLGLVSVLPGLAAAVLAQRELQRIRRLESSDAGEGHARLARGLGILESLVLAGLLVFLLAGSA